MTFHTALFLVVGQVFSNISVRLDIELVLVNFAVFEIPISGQYRQRYIYEHFYLLYGAGYIRVLHHDLADHRGDHALRNPGPFCKHIWIQLALESI